MAKHAADHYDADYYAWQAPIGEFGGWANLTKFERYIRQDADVLDFGCGGGYLLHNLKCRRRVGVEVNSSAAAVARSNGVEVYECVADVADDYVDIVVSDNALEHTLRPLDELRGLLPKLRVGGKAVLVVPCEAISHRYAPNDINHHLYSWSPMSLGNLMTEAGYTVLECEPYIHKWPPRYRTIAAIGGRPLFEASCRIFARLARSWFQVRVVAERRQPGA